MIRFILSKIDAYRLAQHKRECRIAASRELEAMCRARLERDARKRSEAARKGHITRRAKAVQA